VNEDIKEQLDRIEAKLDALLKALADDEDEQEQLTLDGFGAGRQRDDTMPL